MPRTVTEPELQTYREALALQGYAIVESLLSAEEADAVADALRPLQDATPFGGNAFTGLRTRRVYNLIGVTRAADRLLLDPAVLDLVRSQLGRNIQLSIASTMEIFPGEAAQPIHQDDAFFELGNPHAPMLINTMWALTDFTEANGATRLIPGSHTWAEAPPAETPSVAADMPKGSVLVWNGAVWHGGGANSTDAARFGLALTFNRAWLRQQENQYLAIDVETAAQLPEELLRLIGYDNCEFIGFAGKRHPLEVLRQRAGLPPDPRLRPTHYSVN